MKTLDDKFAELPPERSARIGTYVAELVRGYETSEFSHPTRSRDELRLDSGTVVPETGNPAKNPAIELYAERNGELHVLCHNMLTALEYLDCDYDTLHKFRERLHNVPQSKAP